MLASLWRQVRLDPTGALLVLLIGVCGVLGLLLLLDPLVLLVIDASPAALLAEHLSGS